MMNSIENLSTVILTGANGPLGREFTRALIHNFDRLILTDNWIDDEYKNQLKKLNIKNCEIVFKQVNLESMEERKDFTNFVSTNYPVLNGLVNNAANTGASGLVGYMEKLENQSDDAFLHALTVNLLAPFSLIRDLQPILSRASGASIVNIASIYGLVGPNPHLYGESGISTPAGYAASKGGLIQLTKYFATTLAPTIRVNAIAPGGIERGQNSDFIKAYGEKTPLRRMGIEQDMVGALSWLLSDLSAYVTGQTIAVYGGWTAW